MTRQTEVVRPAHGIVQTAAIVLVTAWSMATCAAESDLEGFVCATPQVTKIDRERSRGKDPLKLLAQEAKLRMQPLIAGPSASVDFNAFQVAFGNDKWNLQDSLTPNEKGITLAVHFMDGSELQRDAVRRFAIAWTQATNNSIRFRFDSSSKQHLRVSFAQAGNRSEIGRQAKRLVDQSLPTMILGDVQPGKSEVRKRYVVVHEFGHALGLRHEHQHPTAAIAWDSEAIYADLAPFHWTREDIKRDITEVFAISYVCLGAEAFDSASVMIYPIPSRWTNGTFSAAGSAEVSGADMKCVLRLYKE